MTEGVVAVADGLGVTVAKGVAVVAVAGWMVASCVGDMAAEVSDGERACAEEWENDTDPEQATGLTRDQWMRLCVGAMEED